MAIVGEGAWIIENNEPSENLKIPTIKSAFTLKQPSLSYRVL
jgi:hypothetical protein